MIFSHMHGEVGVRLCEVCLGESSSSQPSPRGGKKAIAVSLTPQNILFSHSDPGTPGLFSGLGTVDVGKVPLGAWSCAITWHTRLQTYPGFSPPGGSGSFWKASPCAHMAAVAFWVLGKFGISRFTFLVLSSMTASLIPHFTGIRGSRNSSCIWEEDASSQLTPQTLGAACPRWVLVRDSAASSRKWELLLSCFFFYPELGIMTFLKILDI